MHMHYPHTRSRVCLCDVTALSVMQTRRRAITLYNYVELDGGGNVTVGDSSVQANQWLDQGGGAFACALISTLRCDAMRWDEMRHGAHSSPTQPYLRCTYRVLDSSCLENTPPTSVRCDASATFNSCTVTSRHESNIRLLFASIFFFPQLIVFGHFLIFCFTLCHPLPFKKSTSEQGTGYAPWYRRCAHTFFTVVSYG